jgi:hypothetical protein
MVFPWIQKKKASSILEWPTPTNEEKQLQSFLGLANNYRRFIPGFAAFINFFHFLLKKNVKYV